MRRRELAIRSALGATRWRDPGASVTCKFQQLRLSADQYFVGGDDPQQTRIRSRHAREFLLVVVTKTMAPRAMARRRAHERKLEGGEPGRSNSCSTRRILLRTSGPRRIAQQPGLAPRLRRQWRRRTVPLRDGGSPTLTALFCDVSAWIPQFSGVSVWLSVVVPSNGPTVRTSGKGSRRASCPVRAVRRRCDTRAAALRSSRLRCCIRARRTCRP